MSGSFIFLAVLFYPFRCGITFLFLWLIAKVWVVGLSFIRFAFLNRDTSMGGESAARNCLALFFAQQQKGIERKSSGEARLENFVWGLVVMNFDMFEPKNQRCFCLLFFILFCDLSVKTGETAQGSCCFGRVQWWNEVLYVDSLDWPACSS
jgi:hypothetical protein